MATLSERVAALEAKSERFAEIERALLLWRSYAQSSALARDLALTLTEIEFGGDAPGMAAVQDRVINIQNQLRSRNPKI